jgi:hypothetical protein
MNHIHTTLLLTSAAAMLLAAPVASAQDDDAPPAEVIATLTPMYFEGHAAYWYHDHWHYRDAHGAWGYYRTEPSFLHDHRIAHPIPERHYYVTGHPAARGAIVGRRR